MAIAFVQSKDGTNDGSASTLATISAINITAGNLLVAIVANETAGPIHCSGIQDDASPPNVFSLITHVHNGSDTCEIWYCKNITGKTGATFTATWASNASYRRLTVLEFSGCSTSAPFVADEYASAGGSGSSFDTGAMPSTDVANSVLVSGIMIGSYHGPNAGTWEDGQTNDYSIADDALTYYSAGYCIETVSAAYHSLGNFAGSTSYAVVVAAFGAPSVGSLSINVNDDPPEVMY